MPPSSSPAGGGRLAIVDREPVYRAGAAAILSAAGFEVEQVPIDSCVRRAAAGDLIGLVLDDSGGATVRIIAAVEAAGAALPVVLVVGQARPARLLAAMEAGALALVHRRCAPEELVAAVRAAVAGRNWVSGPLAEPLQEEVLVREGGASDALTPREQDVLAALATGATNAAIGLRLGISEHTARNHVRAVTVKLGASNRTDAVTIAVRRGLVEL